MTTTNRKNTIQTQGTEERTSDGEKFCIVASAVLGACTVAEHCLPGRPNHPRPLQHYVEPPSPPPTPWLIHHPPAPQPPAVFIRGAAAGRGGNAATRNFYIRLSSSILSYIFCFVIFFLLFIVLL